MEPVHDDSPEEQFEVDQDDMVGLKTDSERTETLGCPSQKL